MVHKELDLIVVHCWKRVGNYKPISGKVRVVHHF
jgi:hypothetical protein